MHHVDSSLLIFCTQNELKEDEKSLLDELKDLRLKVVKLETEKEKLAKEKEDLITRNFVLQSGMFLFNYILQFQNVSE